MFFPMQARKRVEENTKRAEQLQAERAGPAHPAQHSGVRAEAVPAAAGPPAAGKRCPAKQVS